MSEMNTKITDFRCEYSQRRGTMLAAVIVTEAFGFMQSQTKDGGRIAGIALLLQLLEQ